MPAKKRCLNIQAIASNGTSESNTGWLNCTIELNKALKCTGILIQVTS